MVEERLDVDIVAEECKSPSEEGTYAGAHLGGYAKEEVGAVVDFVHLKAIGELYFAAPVVVLHLNVVGITRR